jgi:hypothetical protein
MLLLLKDALTNKSIIVILFSRHLFPLRLFIQFNNYSITSVSYSVTAWHYFAHIVCYISIAMSSTITALIYTKEFEQEPENLKLQRY